MELRQLEYFVAVAEEANFTRAAERVHISQSGVSAQIRQLERDLGATLIDRSGRGVTLTAAGEAALGAARTALAAATDVRVAVDQVTGVVRGRLAVGMVTGCTIPPLFEALAGFHDAHPSIELALLEDNSDVLIEAIRAGRIDVALVGVAGANPSGLQALSIVSEGLTAVVPMGHPLTGLASVTLGDVVEYPIVCLPVGTGVRGVLDRSCDALRFVPDISLQASAPDAVVELAARGFGVAVLAESMASHYDATMSTVPIKGVEIPALLSLVWRDTPSPAVHRLLAFCRSSFLGD